MRSLKDTIGRIIQREQFYPRILGLFINPFYFARKGLYLHIASLAAHITGRTLDVGCGQKPYEKLFHASEYVGLEVDTPYSRQFLKADCFYDGRLFPFQADEFDSIVVNEVFEHVFEPDVFLAEIYRVLKSGGILLMTVPFCWDEHEQPRDYARYSSFGLKVILQNHGFEIVQQRKSMNDIRTLFQLVNAYIYKKTVTGNAFVNLCVAVFLMAPFNLAGELVSRVLPMNDDLYLDNIVLARKREKV